MNFTIEPIFIDTNVLIYARDDRSADKRERARAWLAAITDLGCARTNLQVLNELTRWILKNEPGRSLGDIQNEVETIGAWGARPTDQDDTELAWLVRKNLGYQWFDCLLVAAAQLAGCRYFLTEDMAHGAVFDGLTLINPFRTSPDDVLRRT
ncbi:Predicted nucleic acid-binding protein, contains PIN domain [Methylobacterium phyllostachyos]|uniref:Predicted nucleic acid-binding protein, contains PIN domain n=1 Tax=Methylobacterium phyllostachyos TaxID=582672 RepID=A0A1H0AQ73_9HYPH|nr:PIN domain-containing protein [Methylobacterium phyllostachyos]SDN35253.1 Predicted nucleic acid-binding protein, contains PIN domain [Methylobacterium phyllostachyos]